jgi:exopolyphosphatase/guanosine-5'-triphosphate,3'-diphosphate pyrophosphatase
MRLGVLDLGSNTIHLQVVDAHPGARPSPTTNQKVELRLTDYLNKSGEITEAGIQLLHQAISDAVNHAREFKTDEILAFATSAIRDAKNGTKILADLNKEFDLEVNILSGDEEATMTFLAARRWYGWSSGQLLVIDIGGGSLEIAVGDDEHPEATISLPLGAARLTREYLENDPYTNKEIRGLESRVKDLLIQELPEEIFDHAADHFVATSKTFRTLARLGAHWFKGDPNVLELSALMMMIPKLTEMTNKSRADLPGVSASRAKQIVAGAIVARNVMERLQITQVEICPWALREGIVLRWLDWMER